MGFAIRVLYIWAVGLGCVSLFSPGSAFVGNKAFNVQIQNPSRKPQHTLHKASTVVGEETAVTTSVDESEVDVSTTDLEVQEPEPTANLKTTTEENAEVVEEPEPEPEPEAELDTYRCMALLNAAIGFDASAAGLFMTELSKARASGKMTRGDVDEMLNEVLYLGPDSRFIPFWARWLPLARFSRRARLSLLSKTLDKITPPPSENSSSLDDSDDGVDVEASKAFAQEKRRRALVGLLNSMANANANLDDDNSTSSSGPAIVTLSRKVKQEGRNQDKEDLRTRLPDGLETPDYDIVRESNRSGRLEIRRYKPFSLCSVSMIKPRPNASEETDAKVQLPEMTGSSSFGALAGYLFGKNEEKTSMKMTTPVITTPNSEAQDKQMSFVLPSEYWKDSEALGGAPTPLPGSGVELVRRKTEERAVIMFGGYASKKEVNKRKKELLEGLQKDRDWKAATDDVEVLQYNDPFTVPWRRLNEVSVRVAMK